MDARSSHRVSGADQARIDPKSLVAARYTPLDTEPGVDFRRKVTDGQEGPAAGACAEGTSIGQAGKLSAHDIAYRAAPQAEIIADLRFQKSVEKLHRLGPRVLHVLLCEFAYDRMLQTEIERLVEPYAALRPERLRAVADRFAPAPIHLIWQP
jgi:hypothetical protein